MNTMNATKMRKQRKDIIRIGDLVKVVTPSFFKRCGYPISVKELKAELVKKYSKEVYDFAKKIIDKETGCNVNSENNSEDSLYEIVKASKYCDQKFEVFNDKGVSELLSSIAYKIAKHKKFGGNERKIYTFDVPELKGHVFKVSGKRVKYSGIHSNDSGFGDDGYSFNYLGYAKAHVILTVEDPYISEFANEKGDWEIVQNYPEFNVMGNIMGNFNYYPLSIEKCNVEKIEKLEKLEH